ncbi:hypothetical protein M885DRAFT_442269 [Pelagophyceae sp. CCMP2097]|nr:hypothetical protein M885DRAFT_442269 [Pelagophyceae sp. CCMP2097]
MTAAETEARRRFCAKPLRKGKWTETEQRFSEKLIECFLAGVVQDCTDGTTLRAFLSRKLHCAPMRITKKFAGASRAAEMCFHARRIGATLGKMIFYRAGFLDPRQLCVVHAPAAPRRRLAQARARVVRGNLLGL